MLLLHARIVTMEERDYADGYLRLENGKISAVGEMADLQRKPGEEQLDLSGLTVYPVL